MIELAYRYARDAGQLDLEAAMDDRLSLEAVEAVTEYLSPDYVGTANAAHSAPEAPCWDVYHETARRC